jgi:hypothetical protein
MKTYQDQLQIVTPFMKWEKLLLQHSSWSKNTALHTLGLNSEKSQTKFILMTTEGALGEPQIIRIPGTLLNIRFI